MLTRRRLTQLSLAVVGLFASGLPFAARAQSTAAASSFVEETGRVLVEVVNGSASASAKRSQLVAIIEQRVDIPAVAQFCLGRFWRAATPAQQQEYVTLFHRVLVNNIANRIGDFRGVTFVIGRALPQGENIAVSSVVTRPGNKPDQVDWIVGQASGQPRIIDVVAEGTSLRLTQRQDYASYLSRNGNNIPAFLQALHRQAAAAGAG